MITEIMASCIRIFNISLEISSQRYIPYRRSEFNHNWEDYLFISVNMDRFHFILDRVCLKLLQFEDGRFLGCCAM